MVLADGVVKSGMRLVRFIIGTAREYQHKMIAHCFLNYTVGWTVRDDSVIVSDAFYVLAHREMNVISLLIPQLVLWTWK